MKRDGCSIVAINLSVNRTRSGPGAVVVAFAPEDAIITALDRTEFLVDPRRLENITLVAELTPRQLAEGEDPLRASQLLGIPSGYSFKDLDAWLAAGLPANGLASCRRARERQMIPV